MRCRHAARGVVYGSGARTQAPHATHALCCNTSALSLCTAHASGAVAALRGSASCSARISQRSASPKSRCGGMHACGASAPRSASHATPARGRRSGARKRALSPQAAVQYCRRQGAPLRRLPPRVHAARTSACMPAHLQLRTQRCTPWKKRWALMSSTLRAPSRCEGMSTRSCRTRSSASASKPSGKEYSSRSIRCIIRYWLRSLRSMHMSLPSRVHGRPGMPPACQTSCGKHAAALAAHAFCCRL
jgi:hypothetical protein